LVGFKEYCLETGQMEKVWKLLHLQVKGRFLGYEIMYCLLIESIFKVKQDSDPTYYGNNIFYK